MEKLSEAIKNEAYFSAEAEDYKPTELDIAANEWAAHSLRAYTGELLKRALAISEAIANFTNELEHPNT